MSANFDALRHFGRLRLSGHAADSYVRTGIRHSIRNARIAGCSWRYIAMAAMMAPKTAQRMASEVTP